MPPRGAQPIAPGRGDASGLRCPTSDTLLRGTRRGDKTPTREAVRPRRDMGLKPGGAAVDTGRARRPRCFSPPLPGAGRLQGLRRGRPPVPTVPLSAVLNGWRRRSPRPRAKGAGRGCEGGGKSALPPAPLLAQARHRLAGCAARPLSARERGRARVRAGPVAGALRQRERSGRTAASPPPARGHPPVFPEPARGPERRQQLSAAAWGQRLRRLLPPAEGLFSLLSSRGWLAPAGRSPGAQRI